MSREWTDAELTALWDGDDITEVDKATAESFLVSRGMYSESRPTGRQSRTIRWADGRELRLHRSGPDRWVEA